MSRRDPLFWLHDECETCGCPKADHDYLGNGTWSCDACDGDARDPDGWCRERFGRAIANPDAARILDR